MRPSKMRLFGKDLRSLLTRSPTSVVPAVADAGDRRRCLVESGIALVEDSMLSAGNPIARGYSQNYQIALPYWGAFTWSVGGGTAFIDANRILFINAGEEFRETHPVPGMGHASIIITPMPQILEEICRGSPSQHHSAFQKTSRPSSVQARLLTHRLLGCGDGGSGDPLQGDELTVAILREVMKSGGISHTSSRIVDQAKELLHARFCEPIRLDVIAQELGVTGVYLTQSFTRTEGMPLYRYLMHLRLNKALIELPHRESITDLALDLGFSSHSHFTAAFRSAFGLTPSEFRACAGSARGRECRSKHAGLLIKYPSSAPR